MQGHETRTLWAARDLRDAHRYAFSPTRIELNQGDIIRITLITEDIPHSFTIDEYRISKRVPPEHSVTVNSAPTNLASSSTTVA